MINKDIIDAFKIIAKDKDIETVNLSYIIEELFVNLMHKKYGEENDNFSCIVNMDKGEIEIYQEKVIVDKVSDSVHEISLEDAHKTEPDLEIGDPFIEIINPASFGRRLIFHAKQFLAQKLKTLKKSQFFNSLIQKQTKLSLEMYIKYKKIEFLLYMKEQKWFYLVINKCQLIDIEEVKLLEQ